MASHAGTRISTSGLTFSTSAFNNKIFRLNNSNNFYTNGNFFGGQGIPEESGSNPTNEIVELPNPGDSDYVLRQSFTGTNVTEYDITATGLSASTTYVLSGWYAESPDYVGNNRMFHCRAFSTSGAHTSLGSGIGTQIGDTVVIDGVSWSYRYATITTPADATGSFSWYVGYENSVYSGYRYYTNLRLTEGTFPRPIEFSGNYTITCTNGVSFLTDAYDFDGTNDRAISGYQTFTNNMTWEAVIKRDASANAYNMFMGRYLPYFAFRSNNEIHFSNDIGGTQQNVFSTNTYSDNTWYHLTFTTSYDGANTTMSMYVNGEFENSGTFAGSQTDYGTTYGFSIGDGRDTATWYPFNGKVALVNIYERTLTTAEIKRNYLAYRNKFV